MLATLVLPWRGGCPHRARALEHLAERHASAGRQVVLGELPDGPWVKAAAVAAALQRTDAKVLVICDADVWTDGLDAAIAAVRAGAAWAVPHRGVHRLTGRSTDHYIAGAQLQGLELDERAYLGVAGGGIVVIARDVYDSSPLDPRFEGWGGEDESWGLALTALHGAPWRGRGALAHLWHPPQPRMTRASGSAGSRELRKRYARAAGNTAAMNVLIEEARAHVPVRAAEPPVRDPAPHLVR